jgi:transketolase
MGEIGQDQIKLWSKLGPRAVYGLTVHELAQQNPLVIALSADLGSSSGLDRLRKSYPDRFINVGIAEQCLIGFSAGLANEGLIPFASTFAPFATMRAAEQIRMNLGYMEMNVKVVGIGSGLSMGFLGNSHYGLEDLAIMRTIPGVTILSPADCLEVVKCVYYAAQTQEPTYIRLTGTPNTPIVYQSDYEFEIGKAVTIREGKNLAIIATGSMVSTAIQASIILTEHAISAKVFNFHTIKPLDKITLAEVGKKFQLVVTLEEHSIIGGLGSCVTQFFANSNQGPMVLVLGLPDAYGPTGNYDYLLEYHELRPEKVALKIMTEFFKIKK